MIAFVAVLLEFSSKSLTGFLVAPPSLADSLHWFFLLRPDVAKPLPCWLSQFRKAKQGRELRHEAIKKSIGPILFLCYEESLVSSNLNSKQLRFHGVRPNVGTW